MYRNLMSLITLYSLMSSSLIAAPDVPNPSFKSGQDTPQSWTLLTEHLSDNSLWETNTVRSGKHSLTIRATRYRYGRWWSDPLPVVNEGYSWYTLTGWVKTEHNNGEVYLAIAWLGECGSADGWEPEHAGTL